MWFGWDGKGERPHSTTAGISGDAARAGNIRTVETPPEPFNARNVISCASSHRSSVRLSIVGSAAHGGAEAPVTARALQTSGRKPSFAMGLLGGLAGALIGAAIYFLIFKYTGLRFKLLAVGVGGLAGWLAELLGKGEGSKELGGITAIFVLAGIVGAQYFVALGWWHDALSTGFGDSAYTVNVRQAKEVVTAIPTGSDGEIRNYLAKEDADEGDKPDPNSVSADDVKQFREKDLPEFQDLASGKMTEAQYDASKGIDPVQEKKLEQTEESTFKGVFLLLLISKANIVSLVVAAGVAFRLSANA